MRDEWVSNRPKAEKNSCEFCCEDSTRRKGKDHKIKKIVANFVARPSFFQKSSCSKVYTLARISAISCPRASFVALFHLYSAWCICLAFSTYAFLYAPLCSPPPGRRPGASTNNDHYDYWRQGSEG